MLVKLMCGCTIEDAALSTVHEPVGQNGRHHWPLGTSPATFCWKCDLFRPCDCDAQAVRIGKAIAEHGGPAVKAAVGRVVELADAASQVAADAKAVLDAPQDVIPGRYLHYKGGKYTVLFTAWDSTDPQPEPRRRIVVYVSHTTGEICSREQEQFREPVEWTVNGEKRMWPRFAHTS